MLPRTASGVWALAAGAVALAALPFFVPPYYVELGTSAIIAAMLALSLQLLIGCTGLLSLGHGAFYGLAAYAIYLVTPVDKGLPVWMTLPTAVLVAGIASLIVGALSLRTRGFFFLMVTLAFGQMIFFIFHDTKIGGGTDGAYLAKPMLSAFGYELTLPRRQRPLAAYYFALLQLCAMYAGLALLLRTLFGRVLDGIRINEHRMQALGFNTFRYKLAAFVLAGMLAGVAGHMWTMHRGFVNPELVGWHRSAEALMMILLGGLTTLHGPIVGALCYVGVLREFSSEVLPQHMQLVEGAVILAVVIVLPRGLTGLSLRSLLDLGGRAPTGFRTKVKKGQGALPDG